MVKPLASAMLAVRISDVSGEPIMRLVAALAAGALAALLSLLLPQPAIANDAKIMPIDFKLLTPMRPYPKLVRT